MTKLSVAVALSLLLFVPVVSAQRGGGGGGGFGGGFGGAQKARMDALTQSFTLDKDQRKTIKAGIDDAAKAAMPVRAELIKARMALVAAIAGGKPQAEIDAAAKAYGTQASALAALEMKALAGVLNGLNDEQKKNQTAINQAFFLMRDAFAGDKWDDIPDSMKGY